MRQKKNGETRQEKKKWGVETRDKKNGEIRRETEKKVGRQDARQKKMGS